MFLSIVGYLEFPACVHGGHDSACATSARRSARKEKKNKKQTNNKQQQTKQATTGDYRERSALRTRLDKANVRVRVRVKG